MLIKLMEIGIIVSLILIVSLLLFLIYTVADDYVMERKTNKLPRNRDHWFQKGGHLYEEG